MRAVDSFNGKLAVVTGGGSGMGRELVRQLAAEGCSVATCDLNADAVAATAAMALDGAPAGVRVNAVVPGSIDTPAFATALSDEKLLAEYTAQLPAGRLGQAGEVADAALWLASDASSYVTGVALAVDGGVTAALMSPKLDLGTH